MMYAETLPSPTGWPRVCSGRTAKNIATGKTSVKIMVRRLLSIRGARWPGR